MTRESSILMWKAARQLARVAQSKADRLEKLAHEAPLPKDLRPATSGDIIAGNIIWYKESDFGRSWQEVAEIRDPNDAFKAYVASDGCRYGIEGAWVEREEKK